MKYLLLIIFLLHAPELLLSQSVFDSSYTIKRASVYFDSGKAELTTAGQAVLDTVVAGLRANPVALFIRITAHTDSIGSVSSNQALSARRAESVRAGLTARGLSAAEIEVAGEGEGQPFTSNTTEAGRQLNRRATLEIIRVVPMSAVTGHVNNPETGKGIADALITFRSKTRRDSVRTDSSGIYSVRLPKDSVIKADIQAAGYMFQDKIMKIYGSPELYKKYRVSPDIELKPAKAGEKAVLRDLFFVGNEAILLKVSEPELPKILRFMQINPGLQVEVAGHINHPGVKPAFLEKWEWELSTRRAKLVYDYLLTNGIARERMSYKGYGNTEMLFPNAKNSEEEQQNRRVEIRVLSIR
ncbi:MAG: OmpA family protein [Bacteroidota bacterium]